jgi:hypothetical protein
MAGILSDLRQASIGKRRANTATRALSNNCSRRTAIAPQERERTQTDNFFAAPDDQRDFYVFTFRAAMTSSVDLSVCASTYRHSPHRPALINALVA